MQKVWKAIRKMITAKLFNQIKQVEIECNSICYSIVAKNSRIFNLKFKTKDKKLIAVNDFESEKNNLNSEYMKVFHNSVHSI